MGENLSGWWGKKKAWRLRATIVSKRVESAEQGEVPLTEKGKRSSP